MSSDIPPKAVNERSSGVSFALGGINLSRKRTRPHLGDVGEHQPSATGGTSSSTTLVEGFENDVTTTSNITGRAGGYDRSSSRIVSASGYFHASNAAPAPKLVIPLDTTSSSSSSSSSASASAAVGTPPLSSSTTATSSITSGSSGSAQQISGISKKSAADPALFHKLFTHAASLAQPQQTAATTTTALSSSSSSSSSSNTSSNAAILHRLKLVAASRISTDTSVGNTNNNGQTSNKSGGQQVEDEFAAAIAARPDASDVKSSRYEDVPIEEFGKALLRGMGVTESAIRAATSTTTTTAASATATITSGSSASGVDDNNNNNNNNNSVNSASSSSEFLALVKGIGGGGGSRKTHQGLGAASNPLLANSNANNKNNAKNASVINTAMAAASSRANAMIFGSLALRAPARIVRVGSTNAMNGTTTTTSTSGGSGSSSNSGLEVGQIVMVWQLSGVPGLQKIRIRTLPTSTSSSSTATSLASSSSSPSASQPLLLPTVIVGLKDVEAVLPIPSSASYSSSLSSSSSITTSTTTVTPLSTFSMQYDFSTGTNTDEMTWKELVKGVELEELQAAEERKQKSLKTEVAESGKVEGSALASVAPNSNVATAVVAQTSSSSTSTSLSAPLLPPPPAPAAAATTTSSAQVSVSWLIPGITVRIVDESFHKGKYFRCKGIVQDVPVIGYAQLVVLSASSGGGGSSSSGQKLLLDDVPETSLETALPKVGGKVLVLRRGPHRGVEGELLERDSATQLVKVRSFSDGKVLNLTFDDVAEIGGKL